MENRTSSCPPCDNISIFICFTLLVIGTVGIAVNAISAYIFGRPRMKGLSINVLLIGLSISDIFVLLSGIIVFALNPLLEKVSLLYQQSLDTPLGFSLFIVWVAYPFAHFSQACSIWIFVLTTVERFLVVWFPLKARAICTVKRARCALLLTAACSFTYATPRLFEYTRGKNSTVVPTEMRNQKAYVLGYMTCVHLIFSFIIPFITLLVLNFLISWKLKTATKLRRVLSRAATHENLTASSTDRSISIMMLALVVIFLISLSVTMTTYIIEATDRDIFDRSSKAYILIDCGNLLVVTRASTSAIIYYIFSQKYRYYFQLLLFRITGRNTEGFVANYSPSGKDRRAIKTDTTKTVLIEYTTQRPSRASTFSTTLLANKLMEEADQL